MAYSDVITRAADAVALIREEVEPDIFKSVPEASFVMRLARRLRDMSTHETTLRVTDGLATAYFTHGGGAAVDGDTGRIQTSEVTWDEVLIRAAKLAVIVPIPKDVFADVSDADGGYNLWTEIRPSMIEALGIAFDAAVIHGTNAPTDWPISGAGLLSLISSESQTVDYSTQAAAGDDLYTMLLGRISDDSGGVVTLVEEKGFQVNGHLCALAMRSRLRGCRDSTGQPIFAAVADPTSKFKYSIDGESCLFPLNGALDATAVLDIAGDWQKLVYSLRKGVTFEVLKEASIYDSSDNLQYALAQDDLVALKVTMRLGWQLPRPDNRLDTSTPCPFAALVP